MTNTRFELFSMFDNKIYAKIKTRTSTELKDRLLEELFDEVAIKFTTLRFLRLAGLEY